VRKHSAAVAAVFLFALTACGGGRTGSLPRGAEVGAPSPAGAVEQFMGHVAARQINEMGWVFGTRTGAVAARDPADDVRKRMAGLATVLRHERFALQGLTPFVGRADARQVLVELRRGRRTYQVPFTVVQGPRGRWYVENVDIQSLVGRQAAPGSR
jgi:hypothetical protein